MLMCAACETWSVGTLMGEASDVLPVCRMKMGRIHLGRRLVGILSFVASCARPFSSCPVFVPY